VQAPEQVHMVFDAAEGTRIAVHDAIQGCIALRSEMRDGQVKLSSSLADPRSASPAQDILSSESLDGLKERVKVLEAELHGQRKALHSSRLLNTSLAQQLLSLLPSHTGGSMRTSALPVPEPTSDTGTRGDKPHVQPSSHLARRAEAFKLATPALSSPNTSIEKFDAHISWEFENAQSLPEPEVLPICLHLCRFREQSQSPCTTTCTHGPSHRHTIDMGTRDARCRHSQQECHYSSTTGTYPCLDACGLAPSAEFDCPSAAMLRAPSGPLAAADPCSLYNSMMQGSAVLTASIASPRVVSASAPVTARHMRPLLLSPHTAPPTNCSHATAPISQFGSAGATLGCVSPPCPVVSRTQPRWLSAGSAGSQARLRAGHSSPAAGLGVCIPSHMRQFAPPLLRAALATRTDVRVGGTVRAPWSPVRNVLCSVLVVCTIFRVCLHRPSKALSSLRHWYQSVSCRTCPLVFQIQCRPGHIKWAYERLVG
jgi:hypothetical protein